MNQGLPKLVVERLRAAEAGAHPDADLLTAFAEKSLSAGEREKVLQHLAACGDCREIVALATPEQPLIPPPLPANTNWLSWPYLRWGAALACVVVVGAAVTLRQQERASLAKMLSAKTKDIAPFQMGPQNSKGPAATTRDEADAAGATEKSAKNHKPAETLAKPTSARANFEERQLTLQARNYQSLDQLADDKARADSMPARAKQQNEVVVTGEPSSIGGNRPEMKKEDEAREYLKTFPAPAPQAPASQAVEVTGAAPVVQTESDSAQKAQAAAAPSAGMARKAARAATSGNLSKMSDARTTSLLISSEPALGAQWTLSPEGVLQRSFDSGATWTPVTVAPNLALRAVSASGNDVWVGGAVGALFHSSDNGMHWTQVRPSSEGKVLTGEIIGVEFKDLTHGQLSTTHEVWATEDGGKTWSRRQK